MRKLAIFEEHKCTKEMQLAPPVPRATAVMLACVPAPAPDAGNVCNLPTTGLIQYNNENNLPPNISEANVVLCHINLFWYFLINIHILDSIYKYLDTFIHFFVFSISYRNQGVKVYWKCPIFILIRTKMHELHFSQEALPCRGGRAEDIRRGRLEVIPPYRAL